jgi:DNA helicase-2/ATP-dependent DNA helicase PcrA
VIAPPGCGKTELLAHRANHLIEALEPHQKILALTFSNKAKSNLAGRLTDLLGGERIRRYVSVHNFHGHAAEIVRAHGQTLGLSTDFQMPHKRATADAIAPYLDGLSDQDAGDLSSRIENDLRVAKQGPWDDAEVLQALTRDGLVQSVEIERARQSMGQLHYDDLLRHAQRLIRIPKVAALYRTHYAAVLVDEFQDLSLQHLDIALRSCDRRTFVGDPLQGIYSWSGARPVQVERRLRRISGPPMGLGVSYRSAPNVLKLLNVVSVQMGGQALVAFDSDVWHEGGIAVGAAFDSGKSEATFVEQTARLILEKQPGSTIGVITRMGWRRTPIDEVFGGSDLPSTRWDLAVDNPQIINLITDAAATLGNDVELEQLKNEVLRKVDATDPDTRADVADAFSQIAELMENAGSVAAALSQLRIMESGDSVVGAGVHLLNAHVGKGQQFDWVFIPGFEDGHLPSFLAK